MYLHDVYTITMPVTKIFRSGNSQAVRIPRGFRFRSNEVEILRRGDEVILRERPQSLAKAFEALAGLSEDFFKGGRRQPRQRRRTGL
jgi:antitoxin VapB